MSDTVSTAPKAKAKPAPAFELPKFEIPKFDVPKFEVPTAYREFAEKGISQAKENYEKFKSAAEEATDVLEDTYATASKGAATYGQKVIETARANANAAFDFYGELFSAKSYSDVLEISTAYLHKQFDTLTAQSKDLAACAQKVATETAEPLKEGFASAMKKAA
ncbi:MAG: phasin [Xanthobacteraceae bacterium]|jgi:phasin|uniref:phasin n=1 Tax=Pseudolabrys sp. TaxID=1960880 RepID=UPI003D0B45C6